MNPRRDRRKLRDTRFSKIIQENSGTIPGAGSCSFSKKDHNKTHDETEKNCNPGLGAVPIPERVMEDDKAAVAWAPNY